ETARRVFLPLPDGHTTIPITAALSIVQDTNRRPVPVLFLSKVVLLLWVRSRRMLCANGTMFRDVLLYLHSIWMKAKCVTLITVNTFIGSVGCLPIIRKFIARPCLI